MNTKQQKTYCALFKDPIRKDIRYQDLEALLIALGANKREGRGSRVTFIFPPGKVTFSMHKPHGTSEKPTVKRYVVLGLRRFLTKHNIGGDITC